MVNSRNKGNTYERFLAKTYRRIGYPHACTSRAESKNRDDLGVDLCGTGCWNVQAKCYKNFSISKAIETLRDMPIEHDQINICHIKIADQKKPLSKRGSVVVMLEEDFLAIAKTMKKL